MLAEDEGDPGLLGISHPNARLTCILGHALIACVYLFYLFTVTYFTSTLRWESMLAGGEGDPGLPGILCPNARLTCILGHALIACVYLFYLFTVTYFTSTLRWEPMLAGGEEDPGLPGIPRPNARLTCMWDRGTRVNCACPFILFTVIYFTSKLRWEPMLAGGEGDPRLLGIPRPNTHLTCIWD